MCLDYLKGPGILIYKSNYDIIKPIVYNTKSIPRLIISILNLLKLEYP